MSGSRGSGGSSVCGQLAGPGPVLGGADLPHRWLPSGVVFPASPGSSRRTEIRPMPRSRTSTRTPCRAGWSVTARRGSFLRPGCGPGGPRTSRPSARRGPPRRGSRNGPAAASRSTLPARLRACQRPAWLGSSHSFPLVGCVSVLYATKRPLCRASPERARRVESPVAASGTKVPLAGVDPRTWPRRPAPDGLPVAARVCAWERPGAGWRATMGLSPHDGWLEAVSVQVIGD